MQYLNNIAILNSLGTLKISGEKAKVFLQGQLTCDLNDISPTATRLGAHCNPQGRMISLFRIVFFQENYYLLMPKTLIPYAINGLKKYAVFYQVELQDVSDQWQIVGYVGDQLKNYIQGVPENINELTTLEDGFLFKISQKRYVMIGNLVFLKEIPEISENEWKYLDILSSLPAIYPETSEKLLPHEINLPALNGVSFSKGCYTGQEIIARMQYRGKLKTELTSAHITSETPPTLGDAIVDFCKTGYNSYQVLMITPKQILQK